MRMPGWRRSRFLIAALALTAGCATINPPPPSPNPLPIPSPDLGALYTDESGDPNSQSREQFQSALQSFYSTLNAQATTLAGYIAAWSAAQNCGATTANVANVGFTFPVRLTSQPGAGQAAQATVILQD